jgi:uncharacterized protein YecT (DUF1311 family)
MAVRLLLAAAAVVFSVSYASAQNDEPEVDCANQITQLDMNVCAARDYETADTELNAVYKKAMDAVREMDEQVKDLGDHYVGAVEALKRAQRAWIGYRDGQCELAGFEARGGSMEPMLISSCLADLTTKRTAELKTLYESPEN